jgi:signal transduction histidine kinase
MKGQKSRGILAQTPRSLLIFYVLVIYVFIQFCWWYYLLFDLNTRIFDLTEALARANGLSADELQNSLTQKLSQKRLMIFGEGIVFLLLLSLGMIQTRSSFRRESRLARQQKNFLLSVTHELKSPLASVKLYLQTLSKRELDRSKQIEILEKAIEEANRLDHLVENMLLAARIDNHAFTLSFEKIDLSHFTREFALNFKHKLDASLQTEIEQGIYIQGDIQAMHSILGNLLENAFKYSSSGKPIVLKLSVESQHVVLQVIDSGIGIPDEIKSRIFEKFFRAGNEETRKTKGTGLGLFIVQFLVNQQHAQIVVLDNSPQGSIFEIRFKRDYE